MLESGEMHRVARSAYVQWRIEENNLESLREAVHLAPTNVVALACLARQICAQVPERYPRREMEADVLSRKAVALAPNEPEVSQIRAEISDRIGRAEKP